MITHEARAITTEAHGMSHTSVEQFGTLLLALLHALCEGVDDGSSVHLILFPLTLQQPDRVQKPPSRLRLTNTHTHSETAGLHCPLLKGVNLRSGIIHIYMYLTCSFRLCDCASSFCWRVSSLASYCSRMAVTSLSCCSRARVRVSERHRSIICSFMLSIAASATCCCFRLCVRTHFLSYKRLHHVLHHFNKLQMHNLTWTCCVTDAWGIHELVPLALGLWETGSVSPEIWFSPGAALLSLSPPPLVHWTPSVIQSDRLSHLDKKQQILWLKLVFVLYYLIYILSRSGSVSTRT